MKCGTDRNGDARRSTEGHGGVRLGKVKRDVKRLESGGTERKSRREVRRGTGKRGREVRLGTVRHGEARLIAPRQGVVGVEGSERNRGRQETPRTTERN